MKKLLQLVLLLALAATYGQKPQQIDEYVSVTLPGKLFKLDTVIQDSRLIQHYSIVRYASFIVQKLPLDELSGGKTALPYDEATLKGSYQQMEKGFLTGIRANNVEKLSSGPVKVAGLEGYRVKVRMQQNPVGEARFLILGNSIYTISYIDPAEYNPQAAEKFFNSVTVAKANPGQLNGESQGYRRGYIIGGIAVGVLALGGLLFMIIKIFRK